jgi:hypothetical protein
MKSNSGNKVTAGSSGSHSTAASTELNAADAEEE